MFQFQVRIFPLTTRDIIIYAADDGRSISRNVASINTLVHEVMNLMYYKHWTDKRKYFYVNKSSTIAVACFVTILNTLLTVPLIYTRKCFPLCSEDWSCKICPMNERNISYFDVKSTKQFIYYIQSEVKKNQSGLEPTVLQEYSWGAQCRSIRELRWSFKIGGAILLQLNTFSVI